jgi:hypothetical protein
MDHALHVRVCEGVIVTQQELTAFQAGVEDAQQLGEIAERLLLFACVRSTLLGSCLRCIATPTLALSNIVDRVQLQYLDGMVK